MTHHFHNQDQVTTYSSSKSNLTIELGFLASSSPLSFQSLAYYSFSVPLNFITALYFVLLRTRDLNSTCISCITFFYHRFIFFLIHVHYKKLQNYITKRSESQVPTHPPSCIFLPLNPLSTLQGYKQTQSNSRFGQDLI